jgi:hypothetical protein
MSVLLPQVKAVIEEWLCNGADDWSLCYLNAIFQERNLYNVKYGGKIIIDGE